ncbi:MAG: RluA family pseudouridine synthase [Acidobacteriaceae bacterium]|nr:RluA family pseudouridine synthase [Acidobacteriaceae bacterium]
MILSAEPVDAGKRLDSFLHERLPEFSRSRLQSWIKQERVLVNGGTARASYLLRGGENITVEPADLTPLKAEPEKLPLQILYEDSDVIVVDKAAGMVVHAGAGHTDGTVVNALLYHFGSLSSINGDLRPGIVHRLDRETSGVLAVARTDRAHQSLAKQFHDRQVEKNYWALVHGRMKQLEGQIVTPIARDPTRRTRMTTKLGSGRTALTSYRVMEELDPFSYLDVSIGTGRTHQIRVHLASLHRPIVGDRLYGAPSAIQDVAPLGRFFLHAHRLRFRSPSSGQWVAVESPLPQDLQSFLCQVRDLRAKI